MTLKLGSLFDGAGGFPFAAQICGIEPVWASEIEPFPIAVTSKRFPNMKHLGDVTKIHGGEIEPVDIITFGSPCQSMSCAGKREGLRHSELGDEKTTRSGLFMEAIRIIKEMRDATNGIYPRVAVFENVCGTFSSSKGEDFRTILQSFINIVDEDAVIPRPPKGKWSYAGEIVGDGYSFAWRTLDSQYWGVPQRRRRLFALADFRGGGAGKVLFERGGLSRSFAAQRETWKGITRSLAFRSAPKGRVVEVYDARGNGRGAICPTCAGDHENRITDYTAVVVGVAPYNGAETGEVSSCRGTNCGLPTGRQSVLCIRERCGCEGGGKGLLIQKDKSNSLVASNDQTICFDRAAYNQEQNAQYKIGIDDSGKMFTVIAKGPGGVCYMATDDTDELIPVEIVLRRLTPTECGRLQGMPDWWCDDVPHSDSAEYKMWGEGMALPCVIYVMEGVAELLNEGKEEE